MIKTIGNTILQPAGDTALLRVEIKNVTLSENDRAIFCIVGASTGRIYLKKIQAIEDGIAFIKLEGQDTQNIKPGDYRWDLRIIVGPKYEGEEIVDGDQIHSPFAFMGEGGLPALKILEVGANV